MGQVRIVVPALVAERHTYLSFTLVPEACRKGPLPVGEELPFFREVDDIVLPHAVRLDEHLAIIISPVHDEGSLPQKGRAALHRGKGHVIDGGEVLVL